MIKQFSILAAAFLLSGLLAVVFIPLLPIMVGIGISCLAIWKFKIRESTGSKLSGDLLFRSGLAVIAGAIISLVFIIALMSGLFSN